MSSWLAIYQKLLPGSEFDPMAFESHGWTVEADNQDQALEILEQYPQVPWRIFLVEVIRQEDLEEWQRELEPRHRIKIHCLPQAGEKST